jgi:hypothetical protein
MTLVLSLSLFSALAAAYAITLRRGEQRRQEWRRESRATWTRIS